MAPETIKNDNDFKLLFAIVEAYFKSLGYEIDTSCKDIRRLCFVSHDPAVYVNWDAEVFEWDKPPVLVAKSPTVISGCFNLSNESRCIQRIIKILNGVASGGRHSARLKAARLAGGFIAGGLIDEQKIIDILIQTSDAIADGGRTSDSELKTIADALERGKESPIYTLDELGGLFTDTGISFNSPALAGTDARDGTNNTRPLSELGNAMRLEDAHGGNIHYVHDVKAWLHWIGGAWVWDDGGAVSRGLAARLPDQIYREGGLHLADAILFAKWSRDSQKERTIEAAVSLLEDFEQIRLPLALIDADLFHVGIDNARQVIDLKAGIVREARQSDLITKSLNVERLGFSNQAVRWLQFLDQVFGDDIELVNWIKRWCGYLLTGSTNEQIFTFCYGLGANGKSVLADILRFILGDYARAIASESITESKRQAGSATPDLAELIGARLAISAETEDGAALAESLIKSLVAGDTMSVRKLYCSPIQFSPRFKLMILGNHKPVIKGNDCGIWRRVRLIPFTRTFTADERDPFLLDKLKAEAPHILAWMVEGCLEWRQCGLADVPITIKQATGEYQEEQDLIGNWLSECCNLSPKNVTSSTALYESYTDWCQRNGLRACSNVALGRKLSERGFAGGKLDKARSRFGLAVKNPEFLQDTFD